MHLHNIIYILRREGLCSLLLGVLSYFSIRFRIFSPFGANAGYMISPNSLNICNKEIHPKKNNIFVSAFP